MATPAQRTPAPATDGTLAGAAAVTRCQLCGSGERTRKFLDAPFEVVTCDDCGLVYVTPRLQGQALVDVYGEGYWKSDDPKARGYADYARESALYLRTFAKRMALVQRWLPAKARILDVGCAAGYFLRVAHGLGHDVHGVELSPAIAGEAVAALGAERIHVGTLDEAIAARHYERGSFDLITMWDVVEHIPEPQPVLRRIRELLKPSGHLLIETQNVASRWARLLGRRWHHYKHTEHLYHFSPATIRRLLGDCGFRPVALGAAYAGKFVSFGFLAERAGRLGPVAAFLAKPLGLLKGMSLYVNPHDEIIVVAAPTAD
ncbi:MAG: class I SAM-dependent methyltransferase [Planctomycetes bacterium]|nr:class I SAM-dependent methyltransferase [Planctomycetota bacterium]